MPPINQRDHLAGYGYTDEPKREYTRQQYARAMNAWDTLARVATETRDLPLYQMAMGNLHMLVAELQAAGMVYIWSREQQVYIVARKG